MKQYMSITSEILERHQTLVIYGAGKAGKLVGWILENKYLQNKYLFCDKDEAKWNSESCHPIIGVEQASKINDAQYFVAFMNNAEEKISSALNSLLAYGVKGEDITILDMEVKEFSTQFPLYLKNYVKEKMSKRKTREKISKVRKICFLTGSFSKEKEEEGGGGPIGVVCMQKRILGERFGDVELSYPYYPITKEYSIPVNRIPYMTEAAEAVLELTEKDQNTIYVVNDIFSAFGLFVAGKNYILIFHAQGDVVKEMTLWGVDLLKEECELIQEIERIAVEGALEVRFPSKGGELYFRNSFTKTIHFNGGSPLYNTISDYPAFEECDGIGQEKEKITFLSIGQMTKLKGMDLIPAFLAKYVRVEKKNVRWIVVADGVLKDSITEEIQSYRSNGIDIEYVNIDKKIPHAQIFYLLSISDVYLMLHRVSIFDFSTLEAMYMGNSIILSNIPGNQEFDVNNNILLVDEKTGMNEIIQYIDNKERNRIANKKAYEDFFGETAFRKMYAGFLSDYIGKVESNAE